MISWLTDPVAYWESDRISFIIIWLSFFALIAIIVANIKTPGKILQNIDTAIDKLAIFLNILAAAWIMMMAWVVLIDVIALGIRKPIEGGTEMVANSVIVILFAQIPLAIRHGGMIRTTIIYDNAPKRMKAIIDGFAYILGMIFFAAIANGGWDNMVLGFARHEFQIIGKGTFPLWPFRYVPVWFSVLAVVIYGFLFINLFVKSAEERAHDEAEGAPSSPAH